jgi:hypothetical protein
MTESSDARSSQIAASGSVAAFGDERIEEVTEFVVQEGDGRARRLFVQALCPM